LLPSSKVEGERDRAACTSGQTLLSDVSVLDHVCLVRASFSMEIIMRVYYIFTYIERINAQPSKGLGLVFLHRKKIKRKQQC
jgi:hypothetical protein